MKKEKNPIVKMFSEEWKNLGTKKRKRLFVGYISLFFIAGAINLIQPFLIGSIFNSIQQNIISHEDFSRLIFLISSLLLVTIGFWLFHGVGRILEELTGFQVNRSYINNKIKKVLELPIRWHKDNHSGDTIDKINRGSDAISNFAKATTYDIVYAVTNLFGSVIVLLFLDWKIAIFTLGFSLICLSSIILIDRRLIKYYKELNTYGNKVSATIFDYVSNIITVVTLRLKKVVSKDVDKKLADSYSLNKKAVILNEIKWGAVSIAISLMIVIALIFRATTDYKATGIIMIGTLYMLYGYLSNVGQTFYGFAYLYGRLVKYSARISNAESIEEAYEALPPESSGKLPENWREIKLQNISFAYDINGKRQHLNGINMKFRRAQKIALVGESGSGKSTVLSLLRGLYSPTNGELKCDNKKIEGAFSKLKSHVTLIPQDPELFNNTIKYNITLGQSIKKDELNKIISMAQFSAVVQRLDKGLDTNVLEKGVSLSGGEKQRLALARGLVAARDSEIVLLDEPTSSVDSMNELKIHENVFKEFKNKTIISSIHRLHLLEKFDYIYFFEKGKIIAEGNLNKMKKNPKFRVLWNKYVAAKQNK